MIGFWKGIRRKEVNEKNICHFFVKLNCKAFFDFRGNMSLCSHFRGDAVRATCFFV